MQGRFPHSEPGRPGPEAGSDSCPRCLPSDSQPWSCTASAWPGLIQLWSVSWRATHPPPASFSYSAFLPLLQKTPVEAGPLWEPPTVSGGGSPRPSLWVLSRGCGGPNTGLPMKSAAKTARQDQRTGLRPPPFTCCGFSHLGSGLRTCVHTSGRRHSTDSSGICNESKHDN